MAIGKKYVRKNKKVYKKKPAMANARSSTKNLVKLIKSISLKQQETKMATFDTTVLAVNHNISVRARANMFQTGQGVTDGLTINNRIGDTVTPIGLKCYMTFRQPADRPNVSWKVWILKIHGDVTPPVFCPTKAITGNLLMDPIDTEKATVIKVLNFKAPDNYWQGTSGTSKEMTFFRKLWIPMPRIPYVYGADGATTGKAFQVTMYVAAYDTFGSLLTDTIGSFASSQIFYFKDG